MDISEFIPNNSVDLVIKNNCIYVKKCGLIPLFKNIDGSFYVCLDKRVLRKSIKMIQHLSNLGVEFFLCDRNTISEKHIFNENLSNVIQNYLYCASDEGFFKFINSNDFDYVSNISEFIQIYDCYPIFKDVYEYLKKTHFEKKYTDWFSGREYYTVKNEKIRDFYGTLEREIKLNIFF